MIPNREYLRPLNPGFIVFFFMGYIDSGNSALVSIFRNDKDPVGVALKLSPGRTPRDPVIKAIVELKRGDTIQMKSRMSNSSPLSLLSFSGSLLQELQ